MHNGRDIADGNEPLFVDRFSNENDFTDALHEGSIEGVAQDDDDQDSDNDDANRNMDK